MHPISLPTVYVFPGPVVPVYVPGLYPYAILPDEDSSRKNRPAKPPPLYENSSKRHPGSSQYYVIPDSIGLVPLDSVDSYHPGRLYLPKRSSLPRLSYPATASQVSEDISHPSG